jgi:hypothetical protein
MPYKSKKQAAFIHAAAERGDKWAKKFVAHSHGTVVKKTKRRRGKGYQAHKEAFGD